MNEIIFDDMVFKPYPTMGGYQCIIQTKHGKISVRFGGYGLMNQEPGLYEVFYPSEDAPIINQTAEDIFNYIKKPHHYDEASPKLNKLILPFQR